MPLPRTPRTTSPARAKAVADKYIARDGKAPTPPDPRRYVSLKALGEILGRNRATIEEWKNLGMPAVQRGDRTTGTEWRFDISEVVRWREDQVAEKARREGMAAPRMPSGSSDPADMAFVGDLEPKDRIRLAKQIIDLSMAQRYAASPAAIEVLWTRACRDIGNACMSIPELCARDMGGLPPDAVALFRRSAKDRIASIMKQTAVDFAKSLAELTTPPTEMPVVPDDEEDEDE